MAARGERSVRPQLAVQVLHGGQIVLPSAQRKPPCGARTRAGVYDGAGASFGVHRASWIIFAGLLLTGTACAHGGAGDTSDVPRDDRPVRLHVINRYALPVDIYAYGSGISYRMGTVYPGMTSDFVLRSAMIGGGPVEFVAQSADNAAAARSGQLLLGRGAIVDFDIATRLSASTATVRP